MGNPKQKWTSEEEEALRAGVAKHGAGKWKNIQRDPEFNHLLFARSNIDLKDKWRNLSVASGQGPRDKSKTPKAKTGTGELLAIQYPASQTCAPSSLDPSADVVVIDDSLRPFPEGSNASKYNALIYAALSSLEEPHGSECSAIAAFIEQRQDVPQNFKRLLSSRLRKLVQQDKLEKVQNCYRLKKRDDAAKPRDFPPKQLFTTAAPYLRNAKHPPEDTIENVAVAAAYKIAEAENKSFVAAEAVKEAERVSRMAEDQDSLLKLLQDCVEQLS
ncbi:hypothetical protein M569_01652, partial [Genlisea aurea]